jgi:RNA polymerase sigma-70 factor (ECF subfamily)
MVSIGDATTREDPLASAAFMNAQLLRSGRSRERPKIRGSRATVALPVTASESELTEAMAIKRAQRGDSSAFEFLYSLHKRRVFTLCLRITKDVSTAEELTQEAFLQVYRKLTTFRGDAKFSTWLHRLTVSTVFMHMRKKHVAEVPLEDLPTEDDFPRQYGKKDSLLGGAADRVLLERAIEQLPPGYRLVFVLHDIEGYEHQEIADMLGCTLGNSKSQLHKARLRIRYLLLSQGNHRCSRVQADESNLGVQHLILGIQIAA